LDRGLVVKDLRAKPDTKDSRPEMRWTGERKRLQQKTEKQAGKEMDREAGKDCRKEEKPNRE
jgi:hypothetical protein